MRDQFETADFLFSSRFLITKRKWWNWQTHHLEGVAPKGVGVQIPPSAPVLKDLATVHIPLHPINRVTAKALSPRRNWLPDSNPVHRDHSHPASFRLWYAALNPVALPDPSYSPPATSGSCDAMHASPAA